jgi:hypothetical protein
MLKVSFKQFLGIFFAKFLICNRNNRKMKAVCPSVTDVRWAQTVTATAVVHTSFESLILLVSENVSFFDMGHP